MPHPTSGYLILEKHELVWRKYAAQSRYTAPTYAIPLPGAPLASAAVRYHGLDRDALGSRHDRQASLACIRLAELEETGRYARELIRQDADARDVLGWAEMEHPGTYDLVWARVAGQDVPPPAGFRRMGFEPSYLISDHFSPVCDAMCFPRWHGCDREGVALLPWFSQLNPHGLFDDAETASAYLAHYLTFDWAEDAGPGYVVVEVWAAG